MSLPRDLSGEQLIRGLCRTWNYRRTGQVGNHVVPAHKNLRIGTLNAILRSVATHKSVSKHDVLKAI